MSLQACVREPEVTAALRAGTWPAACEPALRQHVAECRHCAEVVLVTQAFLGARSQAVATAPAASPGALWWRAQVRRRREAMELATRPIVLAEIVAVVCTLGALAVSAWTWFQVADVPSWMPTFTEVRALATSLFSGGLTTTAVLGGGMLALLGGIALYLVAEKE